MKRSRTWTCVGMGIVGCMMMALLGCAERRKGGEHFGEPFAGAPSVTIQQLLETPDQYQRKVVHVGGTIERQCPSAGCWFFINDGQGRSLKIELGDYLPTLPQRLGRPAEVEGELIKKGSAYEFIGTRVTFGNGAKK